MLDRRYSPIQLFEKLKETDKTYIFNGFPAYYKTLAKDTTKYSDKELIDTMVSKVELYHETTLFNDLELVQIANKYFEISLDESTWASIYPELFV